MTAPLGMVQLVIVNDESVYDGPSGLIELDAQRVERMVRFGRDPEVSVRSLAPLRPRIVAVNQLQNET